MCEIIIFIKKNVSDWQSIKKIDTFEIFNSLNTLYLFLYIRLVFYSFTLIHCFCNFNKENIYF